MRAHQDEQKRHNRSERAGARDSVMGCPQRWSGHSCVALCAITPSNTRGNPWPPVSQRRPLISCECTWIQQDTVTRGQRCHSVSLSLSVSATRRPGVRIPSRPPDFKGLTLFLTTGWSSFWQLTSTTGNPSDCSSAL